MESREHPVYKLLQQKLSDIDQELVKADISDEVYDRLQIWKDLFHHVNMVLHTKRFPHVPKRLLDNLQNNISGFNINIARNPRIANTTVLYDGIIDAANKIPLFFDKGTLGKGFTALLDSFNAQTESSVLNFANERKKAIADWEKEKATLQQEIKNVRNEKALLATELSSLRAAISSQQSFNQQVVATFQQEYKNLKQEQTEEFKKDKETFAKNIQKYEQEFKVSSEVILTYLEGRKKDVEKLWGIIGQAAVSGQAQSYATKSYWFANIMMGLCLGFMGISCLIIWKLTMVFLEHPEMLNASAIILRLMSALILFAPAFYCANVAKRQRDREFQLRDFEVKTAALEPFMERMKFTSNDQKNPKDTIKLDLAKTFFDKEFAKENKQHGDILLSEDMIKGLDKLGKIFNNKIVERK